MLSLSAPDEVTDVEPPMKIPLVVLPLCPASIFTFLIITLSQPCPTPLLAICIGACESLVAVSLIVKSLLPEPSPEPSIIIS
jgi:hypothetical protein